MTGWRRWLRMGVIGVLVLVFYFTVPVTLELEASDAVELAISLGALGLLGAAVLYEVRRQLMNPDRRIDALVLALLIAVLGFALGFYVMAQRDPSQIAGLHTRLDALYFTMTTLLTVGFGDIHAAGQVARALVLIQMVFNVVILATAASTINSRIRSNAEVRAEARRIALAEGTARTTRQERRQARRTHRNPT